MSGLNLTWHWSPITLIGLCILCIFYVLSARRVWRSEGRVELKVRHMVAFGSAILLIAIVLLTPIDTVARTQFISVHMIQLVVLTTICAPLLIYASPATLLRPLVYHPVVRPVFSALTRPVVASVIFNLVFLLWHAPVLFTFALVHGTFYHIEMLSLLLAAVLNWWPLIGSVREMHPLSYPLQMLYAFLDGQPVDVFAFLLVFTGAVFYPHYVIPREFLQNNTPFSDQTVAGALLLIPGLVDLLVMSPLFFRWLAQLEQKARIEDEQRQAQLEAEEAALAEDAEADIEA